MLIIQNSITIQKFQLTSHFSINSSHFYILITLTSRLNSRAIVYPRISPMPTVTNINVLYLVDYTRQLTYNAPITCSTITISTNGQ
jgi:hypothetical protein